MDDVEAITATNWHEYLRARGVNDEEIAARGYRWVYSGKKEGGGDFAAAYGFNRKAGGLLIPLHPYLGGERFQLRLADPAAHPNRKGKPTKFLLPQNQANCLSVAPGIDRALFRAGRNAMFLVEGVTRVERVGEIPHPSVGHHGRTQLGAGATRFKGVTTLDDWQEVNIKGARFILGFDGDVTENANIAVAAKKLRSYLLAKGADDVKVLTLPDGVGLDDWIAANGPFKDAGDLIAQLRPYMADDAPTAGGEYSPERWEQSVRTMFESTPDGDATRLLVDYGDRLLLVREPEGEASLRVLHNGVWRADSGTMGKWIRASCESWASKGSGISHTRRADGKAGRRDDATRPHSREGGG